MIKTLSFSSDLHFERSITAKERSVIRRFFNERQLLNTDKTVIDVYRFTEEPDAIHLSLERLQQHQFKKRKQRLSQGAKLKRLFKQLPLAKAVVVLRDFTQLPLAPALADFLEDVINQQS